VREEDLEGKQRPQGKSKEQDEKSSKSTGCPIDHNSQSAKTMIHLATKSGYGSEEKVKPGPKRSSATNDLLNPSNQMPSNLSQMPSRGQKYALSTHRCESTIPKGDFKPSHQLEGTKTWTYPSPQQFYNAMKRKGYNPKEMDMDSVVAIHNTVNERVWKEVMRYETFHSDKCPNPRLEKFSGKANDLSVKARMRTWVGARPPFDRHDWIVDRCGTKVRYIIDFYTGSPVAGKPMSMYTDTRPALDSFGALKDQIRAEIKSWTGSSSEK